jgi:tetratricopeptide (TPR) repeat protein
MAIKAVRAWTYKPATRDGIPITQDNKRARVQFIMKGSEEGVTKRFRSRYKQANEYIVAGNFPAASSLIDELESNKKRLLSEVCNLDVLKGAYFAKLGDRESALEHVERALVVAEHSVSKDMYVTLLRQAVVQNGLLHNYATALNRYDKLLEVDHDLAADDPIRAIARNSCPFLAP